MKLTTASKLRRQGFTLIEMIGVLAVIAILAAVLIPKVFEAINNARINNAAMSCQTGKTAIADHYAKFGSLVSSNGVPGVVLTPGSGMAMTYDLLLLQEGFLDKPFAVKISGNTNHITLEDSVAANSVTATDTGYALGGITGQNDARPGVVVQAVITGVTIADARELSLRIDGEQLSTTVANATTADLLGRVKYAGSTTVTDVYVYLTHR